MLRGGVCPPEVFRGLLEEMAPAFGLSFPARATAALARFLAELDVWRRKANLTGRLTSRELASHALESALGGKLIPHGVEVADIGSGAGFPGIPLAIVRPDIRMTPVEPRRKRAEFLRHVTKSVPVENAFVHWGRPPDIVEDFCDVVTSRAVGRIAEILGEAPFLKAGGAFLAWTTDPGSLCRSLSPAFSFEKAVPVPRSRRKVIALFRKST